MRLAIACVFFVFLSGCTALESSREGKPVGVGGDADMLKKGPCACFPVHMTWTTT